MTTNQDAMEAALLAEAQGRVHQDVVHDSARRAMMRDMTGGSYEDHLFRQTMRATVEVVARMLAARPTNGDS